MCQLCDLAPLITAGILGATLSSALACLVFTSQTLSFFVCKMGATMCRGCVAEGQEETMYVHTHMHSYMHILMCAYSPVLSDLLSQQGRTCQERALGER